MVAHAFYLSTQGQPGLKQKTKQNKKNKNHGKTFHVQGGDFTDSNNIFHTAYYY